MLHVPPITTLAEITDHTGDTLLPQILVNYSSSNPKGLTNISKSLLQWPTVHMPSRACWRLLTKMVSTLYTGLAIGTCLRQPLGHWAQQHSDYCFWHWRLKDPNHLVFQSSPTAATRIAIPVTQSRHLVKFSPTVPTNLKFEGDPVTPLDMNTGNIQLPVVPVQAASQETPFLGTYRMI